MECPICGLVCHPTSITCDCGYRFHQDGEPKSQHIVGRPFGPKQRRAMVAAGMRRAAVGLILLVATVCGLSASVHDSHGRLILLAPFGLFFLVDGIVWFSRARRF